MWFLSTGFYHVQGAKREVQSSQIQSQHNSSIHVSVFMPPILQKRQSVNEHTKNFLGKLVICKICKSDEGFPCL